MGILNTTRGEQIGVPTFVVGVEGEMITINACVQLGEFATTYTWQKDFR